MSTVRRSEPHSDSAAEAGSSRSAVVLGVDVDPSRLTPDERSQIAARLRLTPSERLRYLEDMIAFEELARHARRLT
jgi:hypothetical protein